jgi:hypothetical protein
LIILLFTAPFRSCLNVKYNPNIGLIQFPPCSGVLYEQITADIRWTGSKLITKTEANEHETSSTGLLHKHGHGYGQEQFIDTPGKISSPTAGETQEAKGTSAGGTRGAVSGVGGTRDVLSDLFQISKELRGERESLLLQRAESRLEHQEAVPSSPRDSVVCTYVGVKFNPDEAAQVS